jgi:hypothetical protein
LSAFDGQAPLGKSSLAVRLEPFGGSEGGSDSGRLQRLQEGLGDGLIDLHAANINAAVVDHGFTGAVITRADAAAAIVGPQVAAAMTAPGEALEQRAALPDGAAGAVSEWPGIGGEPRLVGFVGLPIDEARMMVRDQHRPLGARQPAHALLSLPLSPAKRSLRLLP